jgi:hypothetical protein
VRGSSSLVRDRAARSRLLTQEIEPLSHAAVGEQNVGLRQPFGEFQLEFYALPALETSGGGQLSGSGLEIAFPAISGFQLWTGLIHYCVVTVRRCQGMRFGYFGLDTDLAWLHALSSSSIIGL